MIIWLDHFLIIYCYCNCFFFFRKYQGSKPGLLHCRQTPYWLSQEGSMMQGSGVANTEMGKIGRGVGLGRKILSCFGHTEFEEHVQ